MKKGIIILCILVFVAALTGCGNEGQTSFTEPVSVKKGSPKETKGETGMKITVEAGGKQFEASIKDSETSRALRDMLPLAMDMTDLHGNEKFYNLPRSLPTEEENVKSIHTGDLMLFGSDCLVLFYEDFQSSYSYTRIGSVDDASGLADALGRGSAKVTLGMGRVKEQKRNPTVANYATVQVD